VAAPGFEVAEFELESELVAGDVPEWLQPAKSSSRLAIKQRPATRFSIRPPFPLTGSLKNRFFGLELF
jgi:hypothetical protein